jgi:aryl-alcohol dehydrogenase-like predicted oxidoreductase
VERLIRLGPDLAATTPIGFGGSCLMTRSGMTASLGILEAAYEAGVRHFDVAPCYGFGQAERCLGRFLARHPGELTVATKYGIPGAATPRPVQMAIGLARRAKTLRRSPARSTPTGGADPVAWPPLTARDARASIERSLRVLGVDRIDVLLLHEATAERLQDDALSECLLDAVRRGEVGTLGIGTEAARVPALWSAHRHLCTVVQTEWSVWNPTPRYPDILNIRHRSLGESFRAVRQAVTGSTERADRYSEELGLDVRGPHLAELMLRAAVLNNPGGMVLFSSKNHSHIAANVAAAMDSSLDDAAGRLHRLIAGVRARSSGQDYVLDPMHEACNSHGPVTDSP